MKDAFGEIEQTERDAFGEIPKKDAFGIVEEVKTNIGNQPIIVNNSIEGINQIAKSFGDTVSGIGNKIKEVWNDPSSLTKGLREDMAKISSPIVSNEDIQQSNDWNLRLQNQKDAKDKLQKDYPTLTKIGQFIRDLPENTLKVNYALWEKTYEDYKQATLKTYDEPSWDSIKAIPYSVLGTTAGVLNFISSGFKDIPTTAENVFASQGVSNLQGIGVQLKAIGNRTEKVLPEIWDNVSTLFRSGKPIEVIKKEIPKEIDNVISTVVRAEDKSKVTKLVDELYNHLNTSNVGGRRVTDNIDELKDIPMGIRNQGTKAIEEYKISPEYQETLTLKTKRNPYMQQRSDIRESDIAKDFEQNIVQPANKTPELKSYDSIPEKDSIASKSETMPVIEEDIANKPDFIDRIKDKLSHEPKMPENIDAISLNKKRIKEDIKLSNPNLQKEEIDKLVDEAWVKTIPNKNVEQKYKSFTEKLSKESDDPVTKKIASAYMDDLQKEKNISKIHFKALKESFVREWVDDTGNVRSILSKLKSTSPEMEEEMKDRAFTAIKKRVFSRGASANAEIQLDEINQRIFSNMTKSEKTDLAMIRESLRSIEIAKRDKIIRGTSGEHKQFLKTLEKQNPARYKMLLEKDKEIFDTYKDQITQLKDHGLLDKKEYEGLIEKGVHYNPRKVIDYIDPEIMVMKKGQQSKGSSSGLMRLDVGTEQALMKNPELLLQQYVLRTQSRIYKNEANKALYDVAKIPNDVFRVLKNGEAIKPSEDIVSTMVDGIEKKIALPAKLAEEWNGLEPILTSTQAKAIGWASGSNVLKLFATGINPIFAVKNVFRDIGYVYMQSNTGYSSFIPIYTKQLLGNYATTAKDAILKTGLYKDYVNIGGGLHTLRQEGKVFEGALGKMQDTLGVLGDISERWTRLATVKQGIKSGKSLEDSVFKAIDLLDFRQGGRSAKAVNSGIAYFNPAIQGTRGVIKTVIENPKEFSMKLANIAMLSGGLYYYNTHNYKEDYDKIDPVTKANNFVVMLPLTYLDKDEMPQRRYMKIPKDQGQRIFSAVFENVASKTKYDEVDEDQIYHAGKSIVDIVGAESLLPPVLKSSLGYLHNLDLWRNEKIWKGDEAVSPKYQYDKNTPEAYKIN
jgi:hypothetical protein